MKKHLYYLLFFLMLGCNSDQLENKYRLQKFIGHTVGQFLSNKINSSYERLYFVDDPPAVAISLSISYKNNLSMSPLRKPQNLK